MPPFEKGDNKTNLAIAYNMIGYLGLDDLTYTHLSARAEEEDAFYIMPFGYLFNEVTPERLLKIDFKGNILNHKNYSYNYTGFTIHASIYQKRPEINAIFHLHTPASVAVSAMKDGLRPLSQHALHLYDRVSYHAYDSLTLHKDIQGTKLADDLGKNNVMLLENHGSLTCGKTIPEAYFYFHHLEQACKIQCLATQTGRELIEPSPEICTQARNDLLSFEPNLGERDWIAITRLMATKNKNVPHLKIA